MNMKSISKPIVNRIIDNEKMLKEFENKLKENADLKSNKIIKDYPIVYIHSWMKKNKYEVYVGESNDIFSRTGQHYQNGKLKKCWQNNINNEKSFLYIIGHEHFNKSLTLDLENKLIHYLTGVNNIRKVYNNKGNPQNEYYTREEFNTIFHKIWQELKKYNDILFPIESKVADSAIFKSSPLHKLTSEQEEFKKMIIDKVVETLLLDQRGNLIFIEGDVGTGKTVLNCSTFYELCNKNTFFDISKDNFSNKSINCCMIVNHREQRNVYKNIFKKLCVNDGKEVIYSPTRFINRYGKDNPVDVAFVDEAHLLLTQGKQSYTGKNQLQDILDRARVVVIMFDYNQILSTEQYWEYEILEKYKKLAIENKAYKKLTKQLRIQANDEVINWIDEFTKKGIVNQIPKKLGNYDIKVFDTPSLLEKEIKLKAKNEKTSLSRIVATYDWDYNKNKLNNVLVRAKTNY